MLNPCDCCQCGIGQGARTTAITSITFNTVFMLHCFLSVVKFQFTSKHSENQVNISIVGTFAIDERQNKYLFGFPIRIPENEIIITLGILMMSTLRLVLSIVFLLGVWKNRGSLVYPWIMGTIADLVGLFALLIVLSKVAFGEEAFNEFSNRSYQSDEDDIEVQALFLIFGIVGLMAMFSYFIWVAFAFIAETRNNAGATAVTGEDENRGNDQRTDPQRQRHRRNRVSVPSQLRPGGDGLPNYVCPHLHSDT